MIAFDSSVLIYYLEEHQEYLVLADELFGAIDQGAAQGITSVLTLLEVLVKPLRDGRPELAERYRQLLTHAANVAVYPIDAAICERTAQLRAKYQWLRTPDGLQIATAMEHGAELIVTNDERWKRLTEIQPAILKDYRLASP